MAADWLLSAAVDATFRSLTTVFTPATWAASFAAALRAASLVTVPERVTTPPVELTVTCLSGILLSALILFCTSAATCWSVREQLAANRARKTTPKPRYLLIVMLLNVVACPSWMQSSSDLLHRAEIFTGQ